ncbi:hypothetical protein Tco_1415676 [Tanacetum coccineum]
MDLYHSGLTQDDLNDLIIKYKIPCDLYPRLPFEEFVMSELSNDAIGVLVLSGLSRVWKSRVCDPVLQVLMEMLWAFMIFSAFMSGPVLRILLWVLLVLRFLPRLKLLRNERPLLQVSPKAMFPSALGPSTRDSRGKGIMVDDDVAPFAGASRPRPSSGSVPLFRDVSGDVIYADFFSFSAGPYYAAYPEGGVTGNYEFTRKEWDAPYRPTFGVLTKEVFKDPIVCKTVLDQFPTLGEMVRVETLSENQLTAKMSVLHCMMMSHVGELLARYCGYLQSHHEYV